METWKYHLLDFEVFKDFEILKKNKLILWGAAEKGRQIKRTLECVNINVSNFCDSNTNKWGTLYENTPVISPYKLKELFQNNPHICIISCIFKENELLKTLQELKLNQILFLSYWGIKTACVLHKIILTPESDLPIYDDVWRYQKKCTFRNSGPLIQFLKKTQTYTPDQVWILQPGKVASRTIENRLRHANISSIHLHELTYPSHLWTDELKTTFYKRIQDTLSYGVKIIIGVREPLSRDYSAFWQPFTGERPYLMPIFNKDFQIMYEHYLTLLFEDYNYKKEYLKESCSDIWRDEFEWFNEEIKKNIGIDIYQYPFNREKGYQIIHHNNVQIFIYKLERLDNVIPILENFLGKTISSAENSNQTIYKPYYLAYKEFLKNIKLPRSYVNHYYKNNLYMNHFYAKDEQEYYLSQWKNNIQNDR